MTFVPAYLGARLRFLLQFKSQNGDTLDVPAGAYVCRFYKVQGGPMAFAFSTAAADLIVRATGDKGIEFDKAMDAVVGLETRRYLWQMHKLGTPEEWMASGDLTVGQNGGIESRFRVFEAYNGALPKIVAPAFQGKTGDVGALGSVAVNTGLPGTPASGMVSGTPGNQVLNLNIPAGQPGSNGVMSAAEVSKGTRALNLFPSRLLGRKALILDFVGGGYAAIDRVAGHQMGSIENIPGAVIQNSTGGKILTDKLKFENVGANALRYTHNPDGSAAGVLFEEAHSYQHPRSQPTVAQYLTLGALTDTTPPPGYSGNWIYFGDNSTRRYAIQPQTVVTGSLYCFSALVQMTDLSAPTEADFAVVIVGINGTLNPDTALIGKRIIGPFAQNVYLVEAYVVSSLTGTHNTGIDKPVTSSAKTFKLGPVCFGPGRYPSSMFDNATGTPNSRTEDDMILPLSGYTGEEITLACQFKCPVPDSLPHWPMALRGDQSQSASGFGYLNFIVSGSVAAGMQITASRGDDITGWPVVSSGAVSSGSDIKAVLRHSKRTNKLSIAVTGQALAHSPAADFPALASTFLLLGSWYGGSYLNESLKTAAVFDRSWTDSEMLEFVG